MITDRKEFIIRMEEGRVLLKGSGAKDKWFIVIDGKVGFKVRLSWQEKMNITKQIEEY
ncbi:MAG: hypothetical protein ACOCRO_06375 [Halanaerobiales bacterium]